MVYTFDFLENEVWWGGSTNYGTQMPIGKASTYCQDFRVDASNQTMPFFVSNKGRYIWSEYTFKAEVKDVKFCFDGEDDIALYEPGNVINGKFACDMSAAELNIAWNEFGERYTFHEY